MIVAEWVNEEMTHFRLDDRGFVLVRQDGEWKYFSALRSGITHELYLARLQADPGICLLPLTH